MIIIKVLMFLQFCVSNIWTFIWIWDEDIPEYHSRVQRAGTEQDIMLIKGLADIKEKKILIIKSSILKRFLHSNWSI